VKNYLNFKLKLADYSKSEDGFESLTVFVDESPVGAQDWAERVEVKFPSQLAERHERLKFRELPEEELIEFGADLAKLLFPPTVREIYQRSRARLQAEEGLRIQISIGKPEKGEPDLGELELPWEYAYIWKPGSSADTKDQSGFLALDRNISIVRYHKQIDKSPTLPKSEKVRVVALLSDGSESGHDKLDMVKEEDNLRQALVGVDSVDLELLRNGKLEGLLSTLTEKNAQVFHYAGHGVIKKVPIEEKAFTYRKVVSLLLAGEHGGAHLWGSDRIAMELGTRGIRLVVLSACDSGLTGLVPDLVRRNIPAVIGMQFTVRDANAVAFSRRFYQALASGKSIDAAVSEGRHGIFQRPDDAGRDWGVPVLYLQTDNAELFPKPIKTYKPHKILALSTSVVLAFWFFIHIYPWLFHNISQFWEWLGVGGAAVVGLLLVLKALGLEVWKTLFQRKTDSWKERFLPWRYALPSLILTSILSIILFAGTNSIYLQVDYPRDVKVNIKTKNGEFWEGKKTLALSQHEGRLLAGGPVFFVGWWTAFKQLLARESEWQSTLHLSIERPVKWKLMPSSIIETPFLTRRITIKQWKIIRLVPGENLFTRFVGSKKGVWLRVLVSDGKIKLHKDVEWKGGVVYLGASENILKDNVTWDDELVTCNRDMKIRGPEGFFKNNREGNEIQTIFTDEPRIGLSRGQTISIKIFIKSPNLQSPKITDDRIKILDDKVKIPDELNASPDKPNGFDVLGLQYPVVILEETDFSKKGIFTKCLDI
jgi:hypothetical protein